MDVLTYAHVKHFRYWPHPAYYVHQDPMEVPAMYMPMPMPPAPYMDFRRRAPAPAAPPVQMVRPDLVKQGNQARYKTELCRAFQDKGVCKYGEKCQFAHGNTELRALPRHPKYKTEMCRTFHSTGICPYGPRCHFIHNSEQEGIARPRDGPPSVPDTPPPAGMLPFPYAQDTFRSASLPPGGYYGSDQFVPVQFEHPEDGGGFPAGGAFESSDAAAAPASASASAPPKDESPLRTESASPVAAAPAPEPQSSGTNAARSPPMSVSETAELLAAASLSSPPVPSVSSPGSPHPQSPQRRLAIFTSFKQ